MRTAVALAAVLMVTACGNVTESVDYVGLTGVQVDSQGDLSVRAVSCGQAVSAVTVVRDREGLADDQENQLIAEFTAAQDRSSDATLDLSAPGKAWTPHAPVDLDPNVGYIFSATAGDEDTTQVWVPSGKIEDLRPNRVYVADFASEQDGALKHLSAEEFKQEATADCKQ